MFKWFNKLPINYETEKGYNDEKFIKIRTGKSSFNGNWFTKSIPESNLINLTNDTIVYKQMVSFSEDNYDCEYKRNYIHYRRIDIETYKYSLEKQYWELISTVKGKSEIDYELTPLERFKDYGSKYKLIETEDEFNEYLSSTLDCNTWCRMKLYNKMKELGLGDGFINQFADLVGNDLDKYHAMIDLANEVSDKDTLMYLYTYKFSQ